VIGGAVIFDDNFKVPHHFIMQIDNI